MVNIIISFGISKFFYIENDGQNIQFFIFKNSSKTLYFHEKTVIISLFLVRFQIRLIHMTVLFILHGTKEKISKKYFRQVYRGCQIATKIVRAHSHGNNSKSIALRIIPNNSARSWRRRLKKQKKKNWTILLRAKPKHARTTFMPHYERAHFYV